ncbi:FAD-dependent oxidoreductase [Stenotrophomonas sp. NPDC087984]
MGTTNRNPRADVLVLGFGKGGKTVAATLGKLGRRVVMVERSAKMYGGTCPNVGCVPSKALVHHSHKTRWTAWTPSWCSPEPRRSPIRTPCGSNAPTDP